ncbi:hypothetical protein K505DRAFT_273849 [Melanomma pulvis-pyrius CBS 109.77]|uniref:Rhodopsin domain-containing protein n=1 Tax=Melanomma pulvis-pyrius CBS 109.77 TaxID=1314802 RepID=A0A6A6XFV2_9PLEO|nr:hypothetical protein K505DRAFT_273849 [Melanomma pulvis-pyrius CBS 109.77]
MSILQPEASIWYVLCWVVVCARYVSKRMRLGTWRGLQADDYLVVPAMMTLTILMALLHVIVHTSSNLIAPGEDVSSFGPEEIRERIYGSKLTIVVEQMHITTIWLLKACLLIMYGRMTELLPLHFAVKAVSIYVAISYFVMEMLWFTAWCRPFNQYWAVPTNSTQCSAMINHLITNATLNISSDVMIMLIPLPLVFKVKIPLEKKLVLGGIFFIGVFTIFAAAKNKYESFKNPFSTNWMIWYLREAFTAMLCVNLPLTRPFVQRIFSLKDWTTPQTTTSHVYDTHSRQSAFRLRGNSITTTVTGGSSPAEPAPALSREGRRIDEEYVVERSGVIEIRCDTEVTVESGERRIARRKDSDVSVLEIETRKGEDQPVYPGRESYNVHPGSKL